jgi:hypothetical protein
MRNSFETELALFVSSAALDHLSLHGLDDTEAVLDWAQLDALMSVAATIRCRWAITNGTRKSP